MSHSPNNEKHPADDLREVADLLRGTRSTLDPLALDRVKLRALNGARRSPSPPEKGLFMRSRLTMLLTVGFLALGGGGALALTGGNFAGDSGGSASFHQYRCERGRHHEKCPHEEHEPHHHVH
jgi:hypothetical protein